MSIAAVTAFVAAGSSLVGVVLGVVLTARLTGRSKRQEWRRDYVLPIVTEILFIEERLDSNIKAVEELRRTVAADQQEILSIGDQIARDIDELSRKVKELELTASASVSHTATELYRDIDKESATALYQLGQPKPYSRDMLPPRPGAAAEAKEYRRKLRKDLIETMRRDMGLPSQE
jgi:uncharacterized protein YnzC (UPF0291/DUF896 family)